MPNKTAAKEWLIKSWHHYSAANLLFQANHYADVIAIEIHYSVEITLKSILSSQNSKILKTHDLIEVYKQVRHVITIADDELTLLEIISDYHIREAYPAPQRRLPPKEEMVKTLDFANKLFERVCTLLKIDIEEIKSQ